MKYHYVWLAWSSAFLVPWIALFLARPAFRREMVKVSAATSLLGLTKSTFAPTQEMVHDGAQHFRSLRSA